MSSVNRETIIPARTEYVQTYPVNAAAPLLSGIEMSLPLPAVQQVYEEMTPNSTGSRREWKNFEHYKRYSDPPRTSRIEVWLNPYDSTNMHRGFSTDPYVGYMSVHDWWYALPFGDPGKLDDGLNPFYVQSGDGSFVPPPAELDNLLQRALTVMLPRIKAELSLVNSVLELGDLKRSIVSAVSALRRLEPALWRWYSTRNALPFYNRSLPNLVEHWRRGPQALWTLSRLVAGGYLEYSFNLRPLVSDIRGIYAALTQVGRRINDFITRAGRVQVKHFSFNWYEFPSARSDPYGPILIDEPMQFPPGMQWSGERIVQSDASTFHAELEYNYNYTQLQLELAQVHGLCDALGVNLNPSIIWNAIPFSFVIDWVFGVSRFLEQFQTKQLEPQINIRRGLWSIKRSRRISCMRGISWRADVGATPTFRLRMPTVYESAYRRNVWLPTPSSIQSSGVNSREFTLGAALVIANVRRNPRRWARGSRVT